MVRTNMFHVMLNLTGTEKQHVAYDYARHLSEGNAECKTVIDDSLSMLIAGLSLAFLSLVSMCF